MKLLELEIHNTRGIPHLLLKPDGKNMVIWGPNGSGKSAVVDAIDFLLTGRISRLLGQGTKGISLSEHGPHIDCGPGDARVRAVLELPGYDAPVEVERCMAQRGRLKCDRAADGRVKAILSLAERGQLVLTRREILKYITADAGTRGREIQALLDLGELERIRKSLVKTRNGLRTKRDLAARAVDAAEAAVSATVGQETYCDEGVLQTVNAQRSLLGGPPLSGVRADALKAGLAAPAHLASERMVDLTLFERQVKNLLSVLSPERQATIETDDGELRRAIAAVRSDARLQRELCRRELTQLGISLIDESGSCPLCDKDWPSGELRAYLLDRLETAGVAAEHQSRIGSLAADLVASVDRTLASLRDVMQSALLSGARDGQVQPLVVWQRDLEQLGALLDDALQRYPADPHDAQQVKRLAAPTELAEILAQVSSSVRASNPETTPEQSAWDTLTRLEENLRALHQAQAAWSAAETGSRRAEILLDSFRRARDGVLERLYDEVSDRFAELYRQLHDSDEAKFGAKIRPQGAGLDLEVDFFGRGTHPPHALHSEGHQDSMGLCLYLALAERLGEGMVNLTVLDDVIMSIDAGHRRRVCDLLATGFQGKQFVITTHDKTWANQLRSRGIVDSRGSVHFSRWSIDTGPLVGSGTDLWALIDRDLEKGNVPQAASRLRRSAEHFYEIACDVLRAPVVYKSGGEWALGDFLPAAIGQYRSLLRKARAASQSWGDKERFEQLGELDSVSKQIIARSQVEQWAINRNVHFNRWTDFSANDFRPVVEAFHDLSGLFRCSSCGGMLKVVYGAHAPLSVRCNCSKVSWNLQKKA